MTIVFDTNILLFSITNDGFNARIESSYYQDENDLIISVVTEGELYSLALQRGWGTGKIERLNSSLEKFIIYPVKLQTVLNSYSRIDAYSQGKLKNKPLPKSMTARNMGKNDLWIAATTNVTQARLVTTDKDFDHLKDVFFPVDRIDAAAFKN